MDRHEAAGDTESEDSVTILGTCSICQGPVVLRDDWMSTQPQVPRCHNCGAQPMNPYGPVVPMKEKRTWPSRGEAEVLNAWVMEQRRLFLQTHKVKS
jgi:hypothetical protein